MSRKHFLAGKFLLAMPSLEQTFFERAVIFVCNHDEEGAMGIMVSSAHQSLDFAGLLDQLNIKTEDPPTLKIHRGGPVEPGRGFVLHTTDYAQDSTLLIDESHGITATVDILRAIANRTGPNNYLVALGYAGWSPGQLEKEIQENSWMVMEGQDPILFETPFEEKWPRALATLGIKPYMLAAKAGHA